MLFDKIKELFLQHQNKVSQFVILIQLNNKMAKKNTEIAIPDEVVMNKIYFIRGQKVILDSDLAELYK